jgi:hypothetical protein
MFCHRYRPPGLSQGSSANASSESSGPRTAADAQVSWHSTPPEQDFHLDFRFGSNATHWFLQHVRVRAPAVTAVALRTAPSSGHPTVTEHGHAIAATKGLPFECHYLELPLIVVSANASAAPAGMRLRCARWQFWRRARSLAR